MLMIDNRQIFFDFLRAGLWGKHENNVDVRLTHDDWKELFDMAYRHAVTGLFVDGVSLVSMRPDEKVWAQWVFHLCRMEKANDYIEKRSDWWVEQLMNAGISATVFKGTSVAVWYRNPLHRCYGDIDIVVTEGWHELDAFLQNRNLVPCERKSDEVVLLDKNDLYVEFHRDWEFLYNPVTNVRLQRLCRSVGKIDNELYFVCIILHIQRHFLTYGVGLKQVCDVAVMLHAADLDFKIVRHILRMLHAGTFSRILFGFIDTYIGGVDSYPLTPVKSGRKFDLFESVIFNDGYLTKMKRNAVAADSKYPGSRIVRNAWFWSRRSIRMLNIIPGEACGFLLYKVWRRMSMAHPNKYKLNESLT